MSIAAGPSATSASKSLNCSGVNGSFTCLLSGINTNTIPDGVVATANLTLSSGANFSRPVQVTNAISASLGGDSLTTSTISGVVTVPPTITTTSIQPGTQGTAYSGNLNATGGTPPYTWSISGTLPPGLTVSTDGSIAGVPTASGTFTFTPTVRDANSLSDTKTLSMSIAPTPGSGIRLVQSNAAEGAGVRSVSASFVQANTPGNLIIAFVRMSTASQTVSVTDTAGNVYANAVSQVQTADGHQVYIFYAKNIRSGPNTVSAGFSGTNKHPWLAVYEYGGLGTVSPLDRTAQAQGNDANPNTGFTGATSSAGQLLFVGAGFQDSYQGTALPGAGFGISQQDLGLSRAATETAVVSSVGSYAGTFMLSAPVAWSAVLATFMASGVTSTNPLSITTASLPAGTQNVPYTASLAAGGGTPPYTWTAAGSLPPGLTLSPGGVISGTPTSAGTSTITVQAQDSQLQTATKALSLTVNLAAVAAPIALVQSNAAAGASTRSVSAAFPGANTAGNVIIAFVRMSTTSQSVTVTDSAGNVYADAVSQAQTQDGHQIHIFYTKNIKGGPNSVTATFSSTNKHSWLAVYEYGGLSTTNPLDKVAHAQGLDASPFTGFTAATASSNELVFAGFGLASTYTGAAAAGSGFTMALQDSGSERAATETAVVSATGAFAGSLTLSASVNWSGVIATFR